MEAIKLKSTEAIDKAVRVLVNRVEQERGYKLLNKKITYDEFLKNRMLIIHAIREGIPYELFNLIKEITPFSEEDWASFLGISTKSLQRNKIKEDFIFKHYKYRCRTLGFGCRYSTSNKINRSYRKCKSWKSIQLVC